MTKKEKEIETLVAALRELGVDYLTPTDAKSDRPMDEETLIAHLASHPDARLRQALIGLFLLNPHLAKYTPFLRSKLTQRAAIELMAFYMAAVYLQQMWRLRLKRYLGSFKELPSLFKEELRLPDPNEEYGKAGLIALAEWHQSSSGHRFNHLSEYQGVADLVLQSLKMKKRSFDRYSTALSKIERGRTQDIEDVLELLRKKKIEWEQLEKYFQEILPKMGKQSLKQDPIEFEENFRALEALWRV